MKSLNFCFHVVPFDSIRNDLLMAEQQGRHFFQKIHEFNPGFNQTLREIDLLMVIMITIGMN